MQECWWKVSLASAFLPVVSYLSPASAFRHQGSVRYRWSWISPTLPSYAHMELLTHPSKKAIFLFRSWHWIVIGLSQDGSPKYILINSYLPIDARFDQPPFSLDSTFNYFLQKWQLNIGHWLWLKNGYWGYHTKSLACHQDKLSY
jgi:hypothetical protein